MQKLDIAKSYVDKVLSEAPESVRKDAYIHLYGVSLLCALLAHKRGVDPEIASIPGVLHDMYTVKSGISIHHAHSSAEMVRPVIRDFGVFSSHEQSTILSAIFHHSDKGHSHGTYDEILKDADVLQAYLQDASSKILRSRKCRLDRISKELGLNIQPTVYGQAIQQHQISDDLTNRLAEIAEELAVRKIVGHPEDNDYIEIIRYWPDDDIAKVLKNGWCATFVYHCCMQIGFSLPIRVPNSPCRLAGVNAWYQWSKAANLFTKDSASFLPARGDIVIYRNIVPPEKKDDVNTPTDHMGIVVFVDQNGFQAAEGNIGNENMSGVIHRKHHVNIEGFIRIDGKYEYDGWKYDYKSGEIRTEPFTPTVPV